MAWCRLGNVVADDASKRVMAVEWRRTGRTAGGMETSSLGFPPHGPGCSGVQTRRNGQRSRGGKEVRCLVAEVALTSVTFSPAPHLSGLFFILTGTNMPARRGTFWSREPAGTRPFHRFRESATKPSPNTPRQHCCTSPVVFTPPSFANAARPCWETAF